MNHIILDWTVSDICRRKERFCFFVFLTLWDKEISRQIGGFDSVEQAEDAKATVIEELQQKNFAVYGDTSVKEFYRYWLEEVKKPDLAYQSYYAYRNCVCRYIIPQYGKLKMENLMKVHILNIYQKVYKYSPAVAKNLKTVLSTSIKYAERNGYIGYDLITGLKWKKTIPRALNIQNKKALTIEKLKEFVAAAKESDIYLPILFAALMGLRRNEIIGLKYSDVDFVKRQIAIRRQLGVDSKKSKADLPAREYTKQEVNLKTPASFRRMELPDIVYEAILEERAKYEKQRNRRRKYFQDSDYICCSSYGRPWSGGYLWKKLDKLLQEKDLEHITWRNLRTTYTTVILKAGYSLAAVSRTLGHTNKEFTADTYVVLPHITAGHGLNVDEWIK